MERERLTRLMEEPGSVSREDLAGLKALTQRYPWFGGAQLLHALGEHGSGAVLHDDGLRTAAAHLPTRSVLFDAVNAAAAPAHEPPSVVAQVPTTGAFLQTAPPKTEDISVPGDEETGHDEAVGSHPAELPNLPQDTSVIHTDPDPSSHVEPQPEGATSAKSSDVLPAQDPLDAEIERAVMASQYELGMEPSQEVAVPEPDPSNAVAEEPRPDVGQMTRTEIRPHETGNDIIPVRKSGVRSGRKRFTAWLEQPAEEEIFVRKPDGPATHAAPKDARISDTSTGSGSDRPAEIPSTTPNDLIDRFIRQQTPPPAAKAEFFTPQQAGKRSLDDTEGLVTETLAGIYAKQGDLTKARDAYRKLALKYPHKSAYFAALSEKLEDRSTN